MYSATRQVIVNGLPIDINLATVRDIEGLSLIATFTSPLTGKSYALIEKLVDGEPQNESGTKIEESLDNMCLRACKALFEREEIVTHVLYKDYLLSRSGDEAAAAADCEAEEICTSLDISEEDRKKVDSSIDEFLRSVEKHRRFNEYLKKSGLV